jgi:SAM-dependent methyltransferase
MTFKDHFSGHATAYAQFRPRYPDELIRYLSSITARRSIAWDCATGNGQAAVALAAHFDRVIATDASAQQIENAEPHERVRYTVAPAEASGLDAESVDLITVAQALHWFDIPAFFAEARRVLTPGGIVAVWAYNLLSVSPEIDELVNEFYRDTTGPFWPPERAIIESRYSGIAFPFEEITAPAFEMHAEWTLDQLLGYLRTWSATQRFIAARGFDPVDSLGPRLREIWGLADDRRLVRWPLTVRVDRCPAPKPSGARAKTRRGRSCDPPLPATERGFSLAFALRNYFVQLEDWQEHRDDDAANDHT